MWCGQIGRGARDASSSTAATRLRCGVPEGSQVCQAENPPARPTSGTVILSRKARPSGLGPEKHISTRVTIEDPRPNQQQLCRTSGRSSGKVTRADGSGRTKAVSLRLYLSRPGWSGVAPLQQGGCWVAGVLQAVAGVRTARLDTVACLHSVARCELLQCATCTNAVTAIAQAAKGSEHASQPPTAPEAGQKHLDARRPGGRQLRHLNATHWRRQAAPLLPPPPAAAQQPPQPAAAAPSWLAVAQLNCGGGAAGARRTVAWAAAAAPAARMRQVPPAVKSRLATAARAAAASAAADLLGSAAALQRRQRKGPEAGHAAGQAYRGNAMVTRLPAQSGWTSKQAL